MKPYYDKNGITIFCGDCLKVMPLLELLFAAIIADWPYGTTACSWDSVIPLEPLWKECKRLSDTAVLFGSQPFTSTLIMSNLEQFRYTWVWEKSVGSGWLNAKNRPLKCHEEICVFCSSQRTYNPQMRPVRHRVVKSSRPAAQYQSHRAVVTDNGGEAYPRSVLYYPKVNGSVHPTQKPEPLMAYFVRTYTNPGDIVLDNTMGSGTTLLAAQNEGRRAVGIELSEEYCRKAVDRLHQPSFWSIREKQLPEKPRQVDLEEMIARGLEE